MGLACTLLRLACTLLRFQRTFIRFIDALRNDLAPKDKGTVGAKQLKGSNLGGA
jgi:hypothetical protein